VGSEMCIRDRDEETKTIIYNGISFKLEFLDEKKKK
jgi:hypothetical protein